MATGSCKQCGRPMDEHSGGCDNGCFGGSVHEFCSEGCRNAYNKAQAAQRAEYVKKRGEKILKKWKKNAAKKDAKIEKLANALRSGDVNAIEKAYGGGFFGVIWFLIKLAVRIVIWGSAILMWLLIFMMATDPNAARAIFGANTQTVQQQSDTPPTDGNSTVGGISGPVQAN